MPDITLAQYTGFVYEEMIRAREMADAYSRSVAERYARDPVLAQFPIPRFKIPKITLNMPMAIAVASVAQVSRLDMSAAEFERLVLYTVDEVVSGVTGSVPVRPPAGDGVVDPEATFGGAMVAGVRRLYQRLQGALQPDDVLREELGALVQGTLPERSLERASVGVQPDGAVVEKLQAVLSEMLRPRFVLDAWAVQKLLVNPQTDVLRTSGDSAGLFTVKAEMTEDGFFLRNIKDEKSGTVSTVVDFE